MDAPDTRKSSAITDHPFEPRMKRIGLYNGQQLSIAPWLCGYQGDEEPPIYPCSMAEAAHSETTVKR
jgi:hypothetical protein